MTRKIAFTLIELVVVLAIVSVLLTVVKINFFKSKESLALEELKIIEEQLINAKAYAISNGSSVKISSFRYDNYIEIKSKDYYSKKIVCKYLTLDNSIEVEFKKNGVPTKGVSFEFSYKKSKYEIRVRPATGFINLVK